jgi:hypothetical protein
MNDEEGREQAGERRGDENAKRNMSELRPKVRHERK